MIEEGNCHAFDHVIQLSAGNGLVFMFAPKETSVIGQVQTRKILPSCKNQAKPISSNQ